MPLTRLQARILKIIYLNRIVYRPQLQAATLQPVQMTELEVEFSKIDGQKATPTRFIRSQQVKQAKIAAQVVEEDGEKIF